MVYCVGELYVEGDPNLIDGPKKNPRSARKWLLKALEAGDEMALHRYGMLLLEGKGGKVDLESARFYFSKGIYFVGSLSVNIYTCTDICFDLFNQSQLTYTVLYIYIQMYMLL